MNAKKICKNQIKTHTWNLVVDALIDGMELYKDYLTPTEVAETFIEAVVHKSFAIAKEIEKNRAEEMEE